MRYNKRKISERIFGEIDKILDDDANEITSMDKFIEYYKLPVTRQTLSKWRREETVPPIEILLELCSCFNCELGYLLCEYPEKNRNQDRIKTEIFLSPDALQTLEEKGKTSILELHYFDEGDTWFSKQNEDVPEKERFLYSLNGILASYPELIAHIGEIVLNDLFVKECEEIVPLGSHDIDDKIIDLAYRIKYFCTTNEKYPCKYLPSIARNEFAVTLVKKQFEVMQKLNDVLYNEFVADMKK